MGFAAGLRAGSQSAQDAFNTYYSTKDRIKRDKQEAEIEAELAKLDGPKPALNLPKAEFTAEGVAPMQGFALGGAPAGGEITSSPSAAPVRGAGLGLGGSLSAAPSAAPSAEPLAQGFQVQPMTLAPQGVSDAEREAIFGRVARIKGDIAGMRQAEQNRRMFEYKDTFSRYMKEFDADDKGMVDTAIRQLNKTDEVVTIGKPDAKGYRELSFVDEEGEGKFTKLSRAEQAQLYAAGQMMGQYPDEALAKIREINKELGDALGRANNARIGVTSANNQVTNLRNDDTRGDDTLAETKRSNLVREGLSRAQLASQERARREAASFRQQQGRQYIIENGDGQRAIYTPTNFDSNGTALLPQGYRFVQEDGQGGRGAAGAGLKVNSDGTVQVGDQLFYSDAPGSYKPVKGLGPSALDKALAAYQPERPTAGVPYIGAPTPGFRFASQAEMRGGGGVAVDPTTLQRVSTRGLFGGVNYEYRDPKTGKTYSVDEYNRMLGE